MRKQLTAVVVALVIGAVLVPAATAAVRPTAHSDLTEQWQPATFAASDVLAVAHRSRSESPSRQWSASSRWDGTTGKACYGRDRHDAVGDVPKLDGEIFGAYFGCVDPGEWLFATTTHDSWSAPELGAYVVQIDTDGSPSTGCGGFEKAVIGTGEGGLTAEIDSTPTCNASSWVRTGTSDIQHPSPKDIGLLFANSAIGSPTRVIWVATLIASGAESGDDLPDTGAFQETGFDGPTDEACPPVSTSTGAPRRYAVSDSPRLLSVLGAVPGLGSLRALGGGVVTFSGDLDVVRRALALAGIVAQVGTDHMQRWHAATNDAKFADQWNLTAVKASAAWDVTHGSASVVVADIDSGIDATHPDFAGKLVTGWDSTTNSPLAPGTNSDTVGHGTATAGVIGAATNNGTGLASLGYDTKVMPIKAGDEPSLAAEIAGIRYATDNGAKVINMSLGSDCADDGEWAAVAHAQGHGLLVVASAGNEKTEGNPVEYPAGYPGVIAVGATGFNGTIAGYSNTGSYVSIAAPGGSADGVSSHDVPLLAPGGGTVNEPGTSFSSPLVAAAAALVLAANPSITPFEAGRRLLATATDAGAPGRDDTYGAGILDAEAAVRSAGVSLGTNDETRRLAGQDRLDTAIAISQNSYPNGGAKTVVLSRHDTFADALAGSTLAARGNGPLLLTPLGGLDPRTKAEIQRVLSKGGFVQLLGGTQALSAQVNADLTAMGYAVMRYAGSDRFDTAAKIATSGLGDPSKLLLATGLSFADALVAGAAAGAVNGAVLLTADGGIPGPTRAYLDGHPGVQRYAVGSPAAAADPAATAFAGGSYAETSRKVAEGLFSGAQAAGVASDAKFPDSLGGGAHAARLGGPLLLTQPDALAGTVADYLRANKANIVKAFVYGGTAALADGVESDVRSAIT